MGQSDEGGFDVTLKRSLAAEFQTVPQHTADRDLAVISEFVSRMRMARQFYLDDDAAGDGGFAISLALFHDLARGDFTPIGRLIESADVPLSTAVYIIEVLERAGHVRRVTDPSSKEAAYTLSPSAERSMRNFLNLTADMIRITCKSLG